MKLFRSIFMAVVLISPTLAWGEVSHTWYISHDLNTFSRYSTEYGNVIKQAFCKNGSGLVQTLSGITIYVMCADGWIKDTVPTDDEFTRVHYIAECHVQCASNGMVYVSGSSDTHCYCNSSSESQKDKKNARSNRSASAASGASASKTEATGKSKKSDDADTKSTDASDKKIVSHTFSVSESVNKLSGLTKKVAAEAAYRQYLGSKYCDGDGTITIRSNSTQIVCSNGWVGGTQPTDSQFTSEHKKALCYAECAGKEREYVSGTYGKCECSVTREEKRAANQQARDERKDARTKERADRQEERKKEKAIECEGRNPPMDIKQNDLGIWVCVDTEETIKKREEERKTNKTLDAFWNEMEDLERAFNKRVRQLRRDAKRDGGDK